MSISRYFMGYLHIPLSDTQLNFFNASADSAFHEASPPTSALLHHPSSSPILGDELTLWRGTFKAPKRL
jgi:hypothetical protein